MGETVEVWRGEDTTDADGNPIHADPTLWKTLQALVAPSNPAEQVTVGRQVVTTALTLYVRGTPTGVLSTDLIKVRGRLLPVLGNPAVWVNEQGAHVGDVITVRLGEG